MASKKPHIGRDAGLERLAAFAGSACAVARETNGLLGSESWFSVSSDRLLSSGLRTGPADADQIAAMRAEHEHPRILSPELVLVDPALEERSRAYLRDPSDTLARIEALVEASRRAALAQASAEPPRRALSDFVESARRPSRVGQRRSLALAGGVVAGLLVTALMVGVRVDLGGSPAGADTIAPRSPVPAAPIPGTEHGAAVAHGAAIEHGEALRLSALLGRRPPVPPRTTSSSSAARRRCSKVTRRNPRSRFPCDWVFEGRSRSLEPGDYRWYVWPVIAGTRAAQAVVQARLTVPPPG